MALPGTLEAPAVRRIARTIRRTCAGPSPQFTPSASTPRAATVCATSSGSEPSRVLSSRASAQYFADLNHIAGAPEISQTQVADGIHVEQLLWRNDSNVEVELVAIHGGGHGIPQPYRRGPRLLGPSPAKRRDQNGRVRSIRPGAISCWCAYHPRT